MYIVATLLFTTRRFNRFLATLASNEVKLNTSYFLFHFNHDLMEDLRNVSLLIAAVKLHHPKALTSSWNRQ
jgi:hypothetical protein